MNTFDIFQGIVSLLALMLKRGLGHWVGRGGDDRCFARG
jgi:hypothetical protein